MPEDMSRRMAARASGSAAVEIPARSPGGRPSRAEALRRDERLLDTAAALFLDRGFDATSIDALAEAASVGKATVYARYKDKGELFAAVLRRQIDRWLAVDDATPPGDDLEEALLGLARRKMAVALRPEAVSINRIVSAQAGRFPELAKLVYEEGAQRSTAQVMALLGRFADMGVLVTDDLEVTAELFSTLVMGRPIRLAMLGIDVDTDYAERRLRAAVRLFLDGVRPREDTLPRHGSTTDR